MIRAKKKQHQGKLFTFRRQSTEVGTNKSDVIVTSQVYNAWTYVIIANKESQNYSIDYVLIDTCIE